MSYRPTQIAVVVVARDVEQCLPRCLAALDVARHRIQTCQIDPPTVRVMAVLDRCIDGTAQIAQAWPHVEVLTTSAGLVGSARAAGIENVLEGADPSAVWIGCTDADSVVPVDWLVTQFRAAESGADVLLGAVRPDPAASGPLVTRGWLAAQDLGGGHRHRWREPGDPR